jgi:ferredoxin
LIKISLDKASCCGAGYCQRIAPEIFAVVDEKVTLRADADVGVVEPERLKRAEAACPWRVITISD